MDSEAEDKRLAARLELMYWLVRTLHEDDPEVPRGTVEAIVAPIAIELSAERERE